jgi:hypothetical protein
MGATGNDFAQRRAELIARSNRDREAVAEAFGGLARRLSVAETLVRAVRQAKRHKALLGTLAVLGILAPLTARSWLRRASWILPLAIEAFRIARRGKSERD